MTPMRHRRTDARHCEYDTLLPRYSPGWRGFAARLCDERGAATAEYVIATMGAVGLAGLLVVILRGNEVRSMLTDLVHRALSVE